MEMHTLKRRGVGLTGADPAKSAGGYTLFAPLNSFTAHLVDEAGEEVHRWELPYRPGRHARMLADGSLAYNGCLVGTDRAPEPLFPMWRRYSGGSMARYDVDGRVLSELIDPMQHHDAHHLDDGRILYTSVEPLTGNRARAVRGGHPGSEAVGPDKSEVIYSDVINEVSAEGELLWQWRAFDHLSVDDFPLLAHYSRNHWPMTNSVQPLGDDRIVASLRSVSAVIVIDRATGDVVTHLDWTLVSQQHHVTPLDNGNLLIFDNGTFRYGESVNYSRVIEVDPATKQMVWSYVDNPCEAFFTPYMGAAQRLWNGNTLVTEAAFGRIFEITPAGEICWEYVVPYFDNQLDPATAAIFPDNSNSLFRAYRYRADELKALGL